MPVRERRYFLGVAKLRLRIRLLLRPPGVIVVPRSGASGSSNHEFVNTSGSGDLIFVFLADFLSVAGAFESTSVSVAVVSVINGSTFFSTV